MAVKWTRRRDNTNGIIPQDVIVTVPISASSVDTNVFTADGPYELVGVSEVHGTAGNDAGAVTADVVKCTGTTAVASGTTMLASTFDLKSTAETVVDKSLTATLANRKVVSGDRIGINFTGTLTALAGGVITLRLKPLSTPGADR